MHLRGTKAIIASNLSKVAARGAASAMVHERKQVKEEALTILSMVYVQPIAPSCSLGECSTSQFAALLHERSGISWWWHGCGAPLGASHAHALTQHAACAQYLSTLVFFSKLPWELQYALARVCVLRMAPADSVGAWRMQCLRTLAHIHVAARAHSVQGGGGDGDDVCGCVGEIERNVRSGGQCAQGALHSVLPRTPHAR